MRIVKFFIVIGIVFMITSFIPGSTVTHGTIAESDEYHCFMVAGAGNIYVNVRGADNRNLSLYVLTYEDTIILTNSGSLVYTHPVFSVYNFSEYTGIVVLPSTGWYCIAITPCISDPILTNTRYDIVITRATPYVFPFLISVVLEVFGVGLLIKKYRTVDSGSV